MALVLRNCLEFYQIFNEKRDIRLERWPLMGSPLSVLAIIGVYYYVATNLGPRLMRSREPFNIKGIIVVYNVLQVIWNGFVAGYAIYWTFGQGDFNWRCEGVSYENTHRGRSIAMATYFYFLAKIIDMLDTFFFVLRKKQQHISFLHVYHHSIMVGVSFVAVSFLPGGHSSLLGILNSIVHVLMYFYYLLSAWNLVNIQTLGWWKKLLTQAQMIQFVILALHFTQGLFRSTCNYPKAAMMVGVIQNVFMFGMFSDFYYRQYIRPNKRRAVVQQQQEQQDPMATSTKDTLDMNNNIEEPKEKHNHKIL